MDKAISLAPDVERYTAEIKALVGRTAQHVVRIGEKLQAVKAQLPYGQWEAWLRQEFHWSASSAVKMIQVYERFKSVNITDVHLDVSTLYVLAAPSTPQEATEEALALAQQGEVVSLGRAKALVNKHRGTQTLASSRAPTLHLLPDAPPLTNGQRPPFNQTNEIVDWAKWTWNPVTGCARTKPGNPARPGGMPV